jgi:hypothetical protein
VKEEENVAINIIVIVIVIDHFESRCDAGKKESGFACILMHRLGGRGKQLRRNERRKWEELELEMVGEAGKRTLHHLG